jgi:hypothetical protein
MRKFGKDVIDFVDTILKAELNTVITAIQTERTDTELALIRTFSVGTPTNQDPEVVYFLLDSDVSLEELTTDINDTAEIYQMEVDIQFQSNSTNIYNHMEYYIEALQRVLSGRKDDTKDITYCFVKKSKRGEYYNVSSQNFKVVAVELEIRVN